MRALTAKRVERQHRGQAIAAMKRPTDGLPEDIREHLR